MKLNSDWPKVSWARAKARLRGDSTTFGCCGPIGSFSRSCKPSRSMVPPIALCSSGLNKRIPPQPWTFSSVSSSSSTGVETSAAPGVGSSWRQEDRQGSLSEEYSYIQQIYNLVVKKVVYKNEVLTVSPRQQRQSKKRRRHSFISKQPAWKTQRDVINHEENSLIASRLWAISAIGLNYRGWLHNMTCNGNLSLGSRNQRANHTRHIEYLQQQAIIFICNTTWWIICPGWKQENCLIGLLSFTSCSDL